MGGYRFGRLFEILRLPFCLLASCLVLVRVWMAALREEVASGS